MAEEEQKEEQKEETTEAESEVTEEDTEEAKEESNEEEAKEEATEEKAEEKVTSVNVKLDTGEIAEMKKQISELKGLLIDKKKLQDKAKVDETKGEIKSSVKEDISRLDNLIVEKAKKGFALYRDYSKESSDTNLKRLIR